MTTVNYQCDLSAVTKLPCFQETMSCGQSVTLMGKPRLFYGFLEVRHSFDIVVECLCNTTIVETTTPTPSLRPLYLDQSRFELGSSHHFPRTLHHWMKSATRIVMSTVWLPTPFPLLMTIDLICPSMCSKAAYATTANRPTTRRNVSVRRRVPFAPTQKLKPAIRNHWR